MNNSSATKNPQSHGRFGKICRLPGKWFCVHCRRLLPWRLGYAQSHYLPMEASPFSLLQGCVSDLRTALHRMGQRVDALPFLWSHPVGPCYERDAKRNLQPNTRTLACMRDMQRFEAHFPRATEFDWETFQIGWKAGAEWAGGNAYIQEQPIGTCNSPESNSIADSKGGGEL